MMEEGRLTREIAAATAYEALHVPALFRGWAPAVLDAAGVAAGHRVLDVACGTGVLARAAAARVGPSGRVAGVDPNSGMLTVARGLHDDVAWISGEAESLPCDDASFDCVVSQFGAMFFRDRRRAVGEMLRVLVPGGGLAIAVWDELRNARAFQKEVDLLQRMAGSDAAEAVSLPFVLGDRRELERIVHDAGAVQVTGQTRTGRVRFPTLRSMVEADLRGWLPVLGVDLAESLILDILTAAELELAEFVAADGRLEFDVPAHIVSASRRREP